MIRTLKLLSVKQLVDTEKVLSIFSPSSLNVFAAASISRNYNASRNYAAPRKEVKSEIQFLKIQDIDHLKGHEKHSFTTKSSLDDICRFILHLCRIRLHMNPFNLTSPKIYYVWPTEWSQGNNMRF